MTADAERDVLELEDYWKQRCAVCNHQRIDHSPQTGKCDYGWFGYHCRCRHFEQKGEEETE